MRKGFLVSTANALSSPIHLRQDGSSSCLHEQCDIAQDPFAYPWDTMQLGRDGSWRFFREPAALPIMVLLYETLGDCVGIRMESVGTASSSFTQGELTSESSTF